MRERAGSKAGIALSKAMRALILVAGIVVFMLTIAGSALAADDRAMAENIPLGGSIASNNLGASDEVTQPPSVFPGYGGGQEQYNCPGVPDYAYTVWYWFNIPAAGTATIRTTDDFEIDESYPMQGGFNDGYFNAVTALYPSDSNARIACTQIFAPVPDLSTISAHLGRGTYFIQAGGIGRDPDPDYEQGFFHLSVDYAQDPPLCGKDPVTAGWGAPTARGRRRAKTRNDFLSIKGCEAGSTVTITCTNCKPKGISFTIDSSEQASRRVYGLLPGGTKIEIRITKPGRVGYLKRYRTRKKPGKLPSPTGCNISEAGVATC